MKVGILGGTFNPPHIGHLRLAEEVAFTHGLSRIIFIPSSVPPHKRGDHIAPSAHRFEMTRRACDDNPLFEVSDLEIAADNGPSYTVNTLEFFKREDPVLDIFFIIGTDSLGEIRAWRDYEKLFALSNFIVVRRPGTLFDAAWQGVPAEVRSEFKEEAGHLVHSSSSLLIPSKVTGLDISATMIRALCKEGRSIKYLVTEPVRSYIIQHNLYRNGA
ncbi:MAG: nicotinate (nicotinamide) nucleotide adenylyltransferase [Desulfomonile tiedjei]|nr:nicotinate (nicotinamide) nucleotide adenylyltransferase [Desulfomonile tiedjei]